LAEGRPDSAVAAFLAWHRAAYVGASHIFNRGLAEAANAHDRAGRSDSAIALYERALALPSIAGGRYETTWYAHSLRRLGELHESLGHREQAIEYYGTFIDLWEDADPELQPQVEAARAALARLTAEPASSY
jgi:tetratricopeptide (TPR) repeat protein